MSDEEHQQPAGVEVEALRAEVVSLRERLQERDEMVRRLSAKVPLDDQSLLQRWRDARAKGDNQ